MKGETSIITLRDWSEKRGWRALRHKNMSSLDNFAHRIEISRCAGMTNLKRSRSVEMAGQRSRNFVTEAKYSRVTISDSSIPSIDKSKTKSYIFTKTAHAFHYVSQLPWREFQRAVPKLR